MTKTIHGNLILDKDTTFDESIVVRGSILGKDGFRYDLRVKGNIDAGNITAGNITAGNITAANIDAANIDAWNVDAANIDARNIDARNIDAWNVDAANIDARNIDAANIDAWNIDAWFILCQKLTQKEGSKLIAKNLIKDRFSMKKKEIKIEASK